MRTRRTCGETGRMRGAVAGRTTKLSGYFCAKLLVRRVNVCTVISSETHLLRFSSKTHGVFFFSSLQETRPEIENGKFN